MWKKIHTKFHSNVSSEAVWKIMTDINKWPDWHDDLEYCRLEGDFKVGNHFMLKPKGAPSVKIFLTNIEEGKAFTDCTHFFGAKMYDTHSIEAKEGGVLLSNELYVTGPLKWLWIFLVARHVAKSVEEENETLVQLARKQ